jgi:hypothetical protein
VQISNLPSLHFGDISPFETKTARWLMTPMFMGTFYNYSASFENTYPVGYPQLGYHKLVHLVRINCATEDDEIDDFLVIEKVDNHGLPDKLYKYVNDK